LRRCRLLYARLSIARLLAKRYYVWLHPPPPFQQ
jgi:hypothetical protein